MDIKYFTNKCKNCGKDFTTKTRGKDLCPSCNPFNMSFAEKEIEVLNTDRTVVEEESNSEE